jgi:hypothetical protein
MIDDPKETPVRTSDHEPDGRPFRPVPIGCTCPLNARTCPAHGAASKTRPQGHCPDHPGPLDDARDHVCRLRPSITRPQRPPAPNRAVLEAEWERVDPEGVAALRRSAAAMQDTTAPCCDFHNRNDEPCTPAGGYCCDNCPVPSRAVLDGVAALRESAAAIRTDSSTGKNE